MHTEIATQFGKVYCTVGRGAAVVSSRPLHVCPACGRQMGRHTWACGVAVRLAAQFIAACDREHWRAVAAELSGLARGAAAEFWRAVRWEVEPPAGWTPAILPSPDGPCEGDLPPDVGEPVLHALPIPTGSVLLEGATRCRTYQQLVEGVR